MTSKDNYHANKNPYYFIDQARKSLLRHGYVELLESDANWDQSIDRFFVVRMNRSIIAVKKHNTEKAIIVATHNDSPCLKLKPNTKLSRFGYSQVRVAPYGKIYNHAWYDRELRYIGQIVTKNNDDPDKFDNHIFITGAATTIIPSLASHLGGNSTSFNAELHIPAIDNLKVPLSKVNGNQSGQFMRDLASLSGCNEEDIIDWDISLIPSEPSRKVGTSKEMTSGYAMDILSSAIPALSSFIQTKKPLHGMKVLAVFDGSQIESNTRYGAKSDFLKTVLTRIGADETTWANSVLLNLRNYSANNPNTQKDEDESNLYDMQPCNGVYIQSNDRSCTDLNLTAMLTFLAKSENIPVKTFQSCFSFRPSIAQDIQTQINIQSAIAGIPIIGLGSPRELVFNEDVTAMMNFVNAFYEKIGKMEVTEAET
ncbi:hypothetical protein TRFO_08899 [Tritrichomonas foetus]|uniref:aspartyl aminopeptidase n=1 Tax=Tritrichomonas foetus TaxID=1144522 RepID=A0A1J4JGQ8_9EUKA|nr:hypothetical protein TRFO_08899 [Tritrichomonas foetus]|eukprot:OHS98330.1 hypothetical protein TRFO_08899 [Tritrichomonas foetus]